MFEDWALLMLAEPLVITSTFRVDVDCHWCVAEPFL